MTEDARRCTRAMMHLVEAERDMQCAVIHLQGVRSLLPQVRVKEVDELLSELLEKLMGYQQQVFQLSRDGIPSSLLV